ncbi:MAG: hypothetical protein ACYDHU_01060 [Acidimicrobiales bacterium]
MFAGEVIVLVAAVVACVAAVVGGGAAVVLTGHVRRLERIVEQLADESVPLVAQARRVADQAALEMERVGAVLEDTGSVAATVDSASRLAQRTFANPVVKLLAVRAGAAGGLRRLRENGGTRDKAGPKGGRRSAGERDDSERRRHR